ncbi:MAG: beta-galactosidase [Patescibacteria group bacterium]
MLKRILFIFIILFAGVFIFFFIGQPPEAKEIQWGVNFSQKQAVNLKLNWQEAYLAILNDLGVKNIRLAAYWDLIEPAENKYNFNDLDWQIKTAEEKGAKLLLVVGMKTPRWPECHEPDWVRIQNSKFKNQNSLLEYVAKIVNRYENSEAIWAWQVENEPFFPFGECPWQDEEFLKKEVVLVKSLDNLARPVVISDSGEGSFWIKTARLGDVVGITMYRKVWFKEFKTYIRYRLPAIFYWRKAQIIKKLFDKDVIVTEFQAEPWCQNLLFDCQLAEQKKTMDLGQLRNNIKFAETVGLKGFYFWGAEWWYWLKEKQNNPEIWLEVKKLF